MQTGKDKIRITTLKTFHVRILFKIWSSVSIIATSFFIAETTYSYLKRYSLCSMSFGKVIIRFVERNSSNNFKGKKICLRDDNSHFLVSKTINPLLVFFSYRHLHSVANHLAIVYLLRIVGSCLSLPRQMFL